MKKLLVVFDDETFNLLAKEPNMSETVRKAVKLYIGHISPDTIEGIRASYKKIHEELKEQTSILNFIASGVQSLSRQ